MPELYLTTVIDICSRRVVGWSTVDRMHTSLVTAAIEMAVAARHLLPAVVAA